MSAILTFLGGSAFRAIFGEISSWLTKKQDAKIELEHMKLQGDLDAAKSVRDLEAIRVQAALGVQTIKVQGETAVSTAEAEAFRAAMAVANTPTGIKWVDAWNATVRPAFATVALALWFLALHRQSWQLTEWDYSLVGAIAGYFFADRTLRKAGK
jgi:hypothetical protein